MGNLNEVQREEKKVNAVFKAEQSTYSQWQVTWDPGVPWNSTGSWGVCVLIFILFFPSRLSLISFLSMGLFICHCIPWLPTPWAVLPEMQDNCPILCSKTWKKPKHTQKFKALFYHYFGTTCSSEFSCWSVAY